MDLTNMIVTEIVGFMKSQIDAGEKRKVRSRFASGFLFAPDGSHTYTQNGIAHPCDSHHALFLPQGGVYDIECHESDLCLMINFRTLQPIDEICVIETDGSSAILDGFDMAAEQFAMKKEGYIPQSMAYIYSLIARLCRSSCEYPSVLSAAVDFIEKSYCDPSLCNDDIAKSASISTVYLRKLFSRYLGIPPMEYVRNLRIEKSKALLFRRNPYIAGIAAECGFSSVNHFCRAFKKKAGLTPSEYSQKLFEAPFIL